jgi:hypothetical protein
MAVGESGRAVSSSHEEQETHRERERERELLKLTMENMNKKL